jgi:hypothetical protein
MTAAAVTSVSSSVTSRYSGNSAVFDSGPPSSKPMDCLPPGVLPQLTSVGRRSPTVEVFGQLQVARPRTGQQTTSFGGRTYPVSAAAAASPSSNCKWQPIEDAGGHFIPEDDSLPIRVRAALDVAFFSWYF